MLESIKTNIKKRLNERQLNYIRDMLQIRDKRLNYIRDVLEIRKNAILGKQFIPDPRMSLKIETSGVCNLACRFCAYSQKTTGKTIMPFELFQDVVRQAVELGYTTIILGPLTGEIFMDKTAIEKMRWLDDVPSISNYAFSTNFVVPSADQIEELFSLKKLSYVFISLVGHDEDSFQAIAQRGVSQYHRLVRNLEVLLEHAHKRQFRLSLGFRTTPNRRHGEEAPSALERVVSELERIHGIKCGGGVEEYDNWGGLISDEALGDIGLRVSDGRYVCKYGACTLIFNTVCVLADGRVNACSCRDVHGTLAIGDVRESPLGEIISGSNPRYVQLIERQMRNEFPPVCELCNFYRSAYSERQNRAGAPGYTLHNLTQIKDILGIRD